MSQSLSFESLNAFPFPLLLVGEDGLIGHPNASWCQMAGAELGAPFSLQDHLDEPSFKSWTRFWASQWEQAQHPQCQVTFRTAGGQRRLILMPKPQDGIPNSWLILATDIEGTAERIEADYEQNEVALRMSMQQWHSFFQESATGKAVLAPNGEMMAVNPQMCHIFGYSEEEMLQQSPRQLRHPDDFDKLDEVYAALLAGGPPVQGVDVRYVKKDGTPIQVLLSLSLVRNSKGHPLYFAVEIQDDTARREAEAALEVRVRESVQLNQELERSNADLERFAFVASHDLQEPLRKIRVFGGRLDKALEGSDLGEGSRDYLKRMLAATERMQQLISDLLEFSRPTPPQKLRSVDLNKLVQDASSDFEATLETNGGHIEIEPLPTIVGDAPRLRQLLCNLISNALKFRGEASPVVKISAREIPASQVVRGGAQVEKGRDGRPSDGEQEQGAGKMWWEIRVQDNGIGFDEKDLPRLLEVFGRLHPRDRFAGTGIGLAICRKVVQEHGGEIAAHSRPGEGATFIVSLPQK